MFGINLSFGDIFCLLFLLILVVNNQLLIPTTPLMFFLLVSMLVLVTATFYIPTKYSIELNPLRISSDYIKLLASFAYFIIGYNLAYMNLIRKSVKWYSLFGILVGTLGTVMTLLNLRFFSGILFFGDTRFRGLMIDPNYYAVLQVTALVYLSRSKTIKSQYKLLAILMTMLSVLSSGSKTGMVTLLCYVIFRVLESLFLRRKNISNYIFQLSLILLFIVLTPIIVELFQMFSNNIVAHIPAFARINSLFTDFSYAISGNGSGREDTWKAAFQVIQLSPLTGVGIGTYTTIAWEMFRYANVAHNTFLQILAEWGIPLATIFFSYVFFVAVKTTNSEEESAEINQILRDIIIILLIGSMAISLNNARVLWLVLGALVFLSKEG
jgi:O-antigen ligase